MRPNSSGLMKGTFQPSAYFAAIFSVRFSPPPPIQIGIFDWRGRGSLRASFSWNHSPANDVTSSCSRPRTQRAASSSWSSLIFAEGNGMP